MAVSWNKTNRRSLTAWVLIAISLLSGGCQAVKGHHRPRRVNGAPGCRVSGNVGYCETNWTSLAPAVQYEPYTSSYSEEAEELIAPPTPVIGEPQPAIDQGSRSTQSSHVRAASYEELATPRSMESSRRLPREVSARISDGDDASFDYFRP